MDLRDGESGSKGTREQLERVALDGEVFKT